MDIFEKQFSQYLHGLGYKWRYEPKEYKNPPEFLVTTFAGNVLCEVKTLEFKREHQRIDNLADELKERLRKIKEPFDYCISKIDPSLSSKDLKKIEILIKTFFKLINTQALKLPIKFIYSGKENRDARKFVIIELENNKNFKTERIVAKESEGDKYPINMREIGTYRANFKINYLNGRVERKSSYEIKAWESPLAEIKILGRSKKPFLNRIGFFYGVYSITDTKDIRRKINKTYKKFRRLKKLPAILVLFSKRIFSLDFNAVLAAIRGDHNVKFYKTKNGRWKNSSFLFFQRNAAIQSNKNRNISAIAYFDPIKIGEKEYSRYTVIHNYWARNPLNQGFFKGKYDKQFIPFKNKGNIVLKCIGYCK